MSDEYSIDPNDPIEKLIIKSVRLGEIAAKKRQKGLWATESKLIKELEAESEVLWNEAKRLGKSKVTDKNYEDLANAFLKECVEDYEELISGAPENPKKNISLIEDVLEHQTYVRLDMTEQLKHIRHVYLNKFVPYVKAHSLAIKQQWEDFDKANYTVEERVIKTKHHCPMCNGSLMPKFDRKKKNYVIGCTNCKLYY